MKQFFLKLSTKDRKDTKSILLTTQISLSSRPPNFVYCLLLLKRILLSLSGVLLVPVYPEDRELVGRCVTNV